MIFPSATFASSKSSYVRKKWGAEIRSQLKRHKIYTKARENAIINIKDAMQRTEDYLKEHTLVQ